MAKGLRERLATKEVALPEGFNPNPTLEDGLAKFEFSSPVALPDFDSPWTLREFTTNHLVLSLLETAVPDFFGKKFYFPTQFGAYVLKQESQNVYSIALQEGTNNLAHAIIELGSTHKLGLDNKTLKRNDMPRVNLLSLKVTVKLPFVKHPNQGMVFGLDTSRYILQSLLEGTPIDFGKEDGFIRRGQFYLYALVKNPTLNGVETTIQQADALNAYLESYKDELFPVGEAVDSAIEVYVAKSRILLHTGEAAKVFGELGISGHAPSAEQTIRALDDRVAAILVGPNRVLRELSAQAPKDIVNNLSTSGYESVDIFQLRSKENDTDLPLAFKDCVFNRPLRENLI